MRAERMLPRRHRENDRDPPPVDPADAASAQLGLPSRDDTLRFLKVTAEHFSALVRSLSDEQLDRIGFVQGAARRDVAWVVRLVIRHIDEHRSGILSAIARP